MIVARRHYFREFKQRFSSLAGLALLVLGLGAPAMGAVLGDQPPQHPEAAAKRRFHAKLMASLQSRPATDSLWDVTHYRLDLNVDPASPIIFGTVDITFQSLVAGLDAVDVDLRSYLALTGATLDGVGLTVTRDDYFLHLGFPAPLAQGQSATLRLSYQGIPAQDADPSWSPYIVDYHQGHPIVATLSEPDGAPAWWPCKDNPADKATAEIIITAPASLTAVSNGNLASLTDNGNGTRTARWVESYLIPTYLVSLAVTNYQELTDTYVSPLDGTSMTLHHFVYPEHVAQANAKFPITVDMIGAFAGLFGEYPFITEKYGMAEFPWGGGMEHQTITSMGAGVIGNTGYDMDLINAHELAHQWFGDMITMAEWPDIWLNEGFASYCEALWMEASAGAAAYHQVMNDMATLNYFEGTIYNPTALFNTTVYYKGAWVLHMLRFVVGDEDFFQIMRTYAGSPAHRYGSATTPQFQQICETVSGRSLDWFFQEWVYGPSNPFNYYNFDTVSLGGGYLTSLQLRQDNPSYPFFRMPFEFKASSGSSEVRFQRESFLPTQQFAGYTPFNPTTRTLDPYHWLLSRNAASDAVLAPCGFYPNITLSALDYTGVAFTNLGSRSAQVRLSLLDRSGNLVVVGGNPCTATFSLSGKCQEAYLLGALFNLPAGTTVEGSLRVESSATYLESFLMHGSTDGAALEGSLMEAYPGEGPLTVAGVLRPAGDLSGTQFRFANLGSQAADVTLSIYENDGTLRAEKAYSLLPSQSSLVDVGALPELAGGLADGYAVVAGSSPTAVDCRQPGGGADERGSPVLPPALFSQTLRGAHFAVMGASWQTRLRLQNPDGQPVQAEVELRGEDGNRLTDVGLSNPAAVTVPSHGQWTGTLADLFGLSGTALRTGSVWVRAAEGGRLGGCLEFGGVAGKGGAYQTALPLAGSGARAMVFPHVALDQGFYTGVSVLNVSGHDAAVRIGLYDKQGAQVGAVDVNLPPGAKYARLLSEMFPVAVGQLGGYVVVTADWQIMGYEIFGNLGGTYVAAVPGRGLE